MMELVEVEQIRHSDVVPGWKMSTFPDRSEKYELTTMVIRPLASVPSHPFFLANNFRSLENKEGALIK